MDVLLYNSFDVQGHLFRVYFVGKLIILRKDLVRYLFFKKLVKWCYYRENIERYYYTSLCILLKEMAISSPTYQKFKNIYLKAFDISEGD